jgi:tRNA(fMet)-specific endonuclease VapC
VTDLLLDTTFLVDAERAGDDLDDLIADDDDVAVAAVTIAELRVGVELASRATRPGREQFVDTVIASIPVIDYDLNVAEVHAKLLAAARRRGRPRGAHDLIIAATARATGRVVLTADAAAFRDLPDVAVRSHR